MLVGKRTSPVPKTPAMESMALIRDSDCTEGFFALPVATLRFRFAADVSNLRWAFICFLGAFFEATSIAGFFSEPLGLIPYRRGLAKNIHEPQYIEIVGHTWVGRTQHTLGSIWNNQPLQEYNGSRIK